MLYLLVTILVGSTILFWGLYNIIKNKREEEKCRATLDRLKDVLEKGYEDFKSACIPTKEFSKDELQSFKEKYNPFIRELKDILIQCPKKIVINDFEKLITQYEGLEAIVVENNQCFHAIDNITKFFPACEKQLKCLLSAEHYFACSEKDEFLSDWRALNGDISLALKKAKDYIPNIREVQSFNDTIEKIVKIRKQHNVQYVNDMLLSRNKFFETALEYPLDDQQRLAIVKLEDNGLVVSSAGSGKTSTIIGRCKYLLEQENVPANRILLISFTRKAAEELRDRLGYEDVQCSTFHGLAYKILSIVNDEKPSITDEGLKLNVFNRLMKTEKFRDAVVHYINHMQRFMLFAHQYETAEQYYADRKKYGIQSLYRDMQGDISFTKSEEEYQIAVYLTELGVSYRYEEPYKYKTYTKEYRQYRPDFTIYYNDAEGLLHTVYLEHYAIDKNSRVPRWFGEGKKGGWTEANRIYNEGIQWKESLHADHGTTLIATHSYDFHEKRIRQVLINELKRVGVPIKERTSEELRAMLVSRSKQIEKSVVQLITSFANLLKANQIDINELIQNCEKEQEKRNLFIIKEIVKPYYELYEVTKKNRGEKDFTDCIIEATDLCNEGKWMEEYSHILVDEFQDISLDRYRFLQALRSKRPLTKLFCVGDDWQSIYRFTGSDMSLFNEFQRYFGYTEESRIETTYRFGNPLMDISSDFIQKNPIQKKKNLRQGKAETVTNLFFKEVEKDGMLDAVTSIIATIPSEDSILILGRYVYDARSIGYDYPLSDANRKNIFVNIEGRKVQFLTCHSSKGLEADHVLLINCNQGVYGFPSLVEDDPLLRYVLSNKDEYEYSEERRLFYVAITRGRKDTYVLYEKNNSSIFIEELYDVTPDEMELCPVCKIGHLEAVRSNVAKNGTPYTLYRCSNYQAGCEYQKYEFENN